MENQTIELLRLEWILSLILPFYLPLSVCVYFFLYLLRLLSPTSPAIF